MKRKKENSKNVCKNTNGTDLRRLPQVRQTKHQAGQTKHQVHLTKHQVHKTKHQVRQAKH